MQQDYTGLEKKIEVAEENDIPEEVKKLIKQNEEVVRAEEVNIDKLIEQQKHLKKKPTGKQKEKGIGFSVCEGRLIEALEQSKRSMDVFYNQSIDNNRLSRTKQMISVYAINRTELLGVKELFEGLQDSIINIKHRQARDICLTQLSILEQIDLQKHYELDDKELQSHNDFVLFTRCFVDWMSAMHNIMLDQSSYSKRKRHYDLFISKYSDYSSDYTPPTSSSGSLDSTNIGVFKSGSKNRFSTLKEQQQLLSNSSITFHPTTIHSEEDND